MTLPYTDAHLSVGNKGQWILVNHEPPLPYSPASIARAVATAAQHMGRLWVNKKKGYTHLSFLGICSVTIDSIRYKILHAGVVPNVGDAILIRSTTRGVNFDHIITCGFLDPRGNNSLHKPVR
jgi:hypothetical protein